MVRKSKMSKSFCKALIFICIVAILYSLVRSFLFPSQEGLDNKGLNDFVTGAGNIKASSSQSLPKVCMSGDAWNKASEDSGCSWDVDVNDKNSCNTFQKGVCLEQCKGIWCNPDPKANPDSRCDKSDGAWCQKVGEGPSDKQACKKPEGWCIHESAKPTYKECGGKKGWWCEDGVNNKGFISCDHKPGEAWPYFGPNGKC